MGPLSQVWVLVDDVPAGLRSIPFMMAFGALIGKSVEVDVDSLDKIDPVRIKVWCVDPVCVRGVIDVFPSSDGVRLRVRVEGAEEFQAPPPPPPPSNPQDSDKGGNNGGGFAYGTVP